jgi:hypothetical protein
MALAPTDQLGQLAARPSKANPRLVERCKHLF